MEHSHDARSAYQPRMSKQRAERLRRWHEDALKSGRRGEAITITVYGCTFSVPPEVYPPNPLGLAELIPGEVEGDGPGSRLGHGVWCQRNRRRLEIAPWGRGRCESDRGRLRETQRRTERRCRAGRSPGERPLRECFRSV